MGPPVFFGKGSGENVEPIWFSERSTNSVMAAEAAIQASRLLGSIVDKVLF
jgi:hypothetical protein